MTAYKSFGKEELLFLMMVLMIVISALFMTNINPTGRSISNSQEIKVLTMNEAYSQNQIIDLNLINLTQLRISGTYRGDENSIANVFAKTSEGTTLKIAEIKINKETSSVSTFTAKVIDQTNTNQNTEIEETYNDLNDVMGADVEAELGINDVDVDVDVDVDADVDAEIDVDDEGDNSNNNTDNNESDKNDVVVIDDVVIGDVVSGDVVIDDVVIDDVVIDDDEVIIDYMYTQEFTNICYQTCLLPEQIEITQLIIELDGGELILSELLYVQETNNFGNGIIANVENLELTIGEIVTLNAQNYFEENDLIYDAKSSQGYTFQVNENEIIFSAEKEGIWESTLYATDGATLIISNKFNITIIKGENQTQNPIVDEPNETIPEIINPDTTPTIELNETQQNTTNETTSPIIENPLENLTETNETIVPVEEGCDNPNPNMRPLECIQHENSTYFPQENLFLENKQAEIVGKFTPIGNLLIKGRVIQNSNDKPAQNDYQIGYANNNGEFVPTIWINTQTGNLHLKGNLIEENSNLILEPGFSAITNRRDILLASMNRVEGNMFIRGNIVPYRESLE